MVGGGEGRKPGDSWLHFQPDVLTVHGHKSYLVLVNSGKFNLTQIVILGKVSLQITMWQLGSASLQELFRRILTNNANK